MRSCFNCNSTITYTDKRGYDHWRKHDGNYYCSKCYTNLFANPKNKARNDPIYRSRQLWFKNKQVRLKENPRTGYCMRCRNNIHDGSCKRTHMHHIEYHQDDPTKDVVELCARCHGILHRKI